MRRVTIEVSSIEKLKEEVKTVEELDAMTINELDKLLESMTYPEALRLKKFMEKWGLI